MTTNTMRFREGASVEYRGDAHLMIVAHVIDSRMSYGREQYLITPAHGAGQRWVDAGMLSPLPYDLPKVAV